MLYRWVSYNTKCVLWFWKMQGGRACPSDNRCLGLSNTVDMSRAMSLWESGAGNMFWVQFPFLLRELIHNLLRYLEYSPWTGELDCLLVLVPLAQSNRNRIFFSLQSHHSFYIRGLASFGNIGRHSDSCIYGVTSVHSIFALILWRSVITWYQDDIPRSLHPNFDLRE
jgi:hypothetical protein